MGVDLHGHPVGGYEFFPQGLKGAASLNLFSQPRINISIAARGFRHAALLFGIPNYEIY